MKSILQVLGELFFPLRGVYPLDGTLEARYYYFAIERRGDKDYKPRRFGDNCKNDGSFKYFRKVLD